MSRERQIVSCVDGACTLVQKYPLLLAEVKIMRNQLAIAVEGLEELSTLGNGHIRGNSIGNIIAGTALDRLCEIGESI